MFIKLSSVYHIVLVMLARRLPVRFSLHPLASDFEEW